MVPTRNHILVVDDDRGTQALLREALERRDYQVSAVDDAECALEAMARQHFDLVLLDVCLRGMNGLDAVRAMQALDHRTPIIVMTAHSTRDTAAEAVGRGAYDYCRKPFRIDDLERIVRRALEKRRLVAELEQLREQLAAGGPAAGGSGPLTLGERVDLLERAFVLDALARSGGVQAAAARLLGVSERSMWHLVKKHRIEVARMKELGVQESGVRS